VTAAGQLSLLGRDEPACDLSFADLERIELPEGAWIDLARGWLSGHAQLFEHLLHSARWQTSERKMYDQEVQVPRLHAVLGVDAHPLLVTVRDALNARYQTDFDRLGAALYRDGRDSVAWHGDYVARKMDEALVATVSVGSPRRFLVRPAGGGRSIGFDLGFGDLLVMGGSCQRTHQHCVPKRAHAEPRIALMYRPTWETPGKGRDRYA
jgi:alkylated DNA repair dioxygenase AlkB